VAVTTHAVPGFDPEDIFGVRRALRGLPDHLQDDFLAAWVELAERAACDVQAVRRAAHDSARACARDGRDRMGSAWRTVHEAMSAYLEWRTAGH
jgi:hypothetical protein